MAYGTSCTAVPAAIVLPGAQAFPFVTKSFLPGSANALVWAFGGFSAIDDTELIPLALAETRTLASALAAQPGSSSFAGGAAYDFWSHATFVAGKRVFLVGGATQTGLGGGSVPSVLNTSVFASYDATTATVGTLQASPQNLTRKRGAMAFVHLPPHVYSFGGLICDHVTEVCAGPTIALSPDIEHGELTP